MKQITPEAKRFAHEDPRNLTTPIKKTSHIEGDGTDIVLPHKISTSSAMNAIPLVHAGAKELDPREDAMDSGLIGRANENGVKKGNAAAKREARRQANKEEHEGLSHFAEYGGAAKQDAACKEGKASSAGVVHAGAQKINAKKEASSKTGRSEKTGDETIRARKSKQAEQEAKTQENARRARAQVPLADDEQYGFDAETMERIRKMSMTGTSSAILPLDERDNARKNGRRSKKKPGRASRWTGLGLIIVGALLVITAGAFFFYSLEPVDDTIKMVKVDQYDVPDGMLQEGASDIGTDIVYIYDLKSNESPYAIESHAVKDGLLGQRSDLYEQWDGTSTFKEATKEEKVTSDVVNFRQIVVHLPIEARGLVSADTQEQ